MYGSACETPWSPRTGDEEFDLLRTSVTIGGVDLDEPDLQAVPLATVMSALGDDVRLRILHALDVQGETQCGTLDLGVSKATRSHHFKVLREAGVTHTRVDGTRRFVSLRRDELAERFPGLLDALLAAQLAETAQPV